MLRLCKFVKTIHNTKKQICFNNYFRNLYQKISYLPSAHPHILFKRTNHDVKSVEFSKYLPLQLIQSITLVQALLTNFFYSFIRIDTIDLKTSNELRNGNFSVQRRYYLIIWYVCLTAQR